MSDKYILHGRDAVPACLMDWAKWFETADRHVAEEIQCGVRVSTVFLGIDYRIGDGPPLIFETMVFGGPLDGETERYSTWDDADRGHGVMLNRVREADAAQRAAISTEKAD